MLCEWKHEQLTTARKRTRPIYYYPRRSISRALSPWTEALGPENPFPSPSLPPSFLFLTVPHPFPLPSPLSSPPSLPHRVASVRSVLGQGRAGHPRALAWGTTPHALTNLLLGLLGINIAKGRGGSEAHEQRQGQQAEDETSHDAGVLVPVSYV
jgi:hypothetical protein